MIAEVISIGDELTSGQRLDTNSQWLSERLGELGVRVLYHTTVADDLAANVAVFRTAIERADVVVATGGLGPTADDLTREALAEVAGPRAGARRSRRSSTFAGCSPATSATCPSATACRPCFPAGSRIIPNPNGTAPGIWLDVPRARRRRVPRVRPAGRAGRDVRDVPPDRRAGRARLERAAARHPPPPHQVFRRRRKPRRADAARPDPPRPATLGRHHGPRRHDHAAHHGRRRHAPRSATPRWSRPWPRSASAWARSSSARRTTSWKTPSCACWSSTNKTLATVEVGTAGALAEWLAARRRHGGHYLGGQVICDSPAMLAHWLGPEAEPRRTVRRDVAGSGRSDGRALSRSSAAPTSPWRSAPFRPRRRPRRPTPFTSPWPRPTR